MPVEKWPEVVERSEPLMHLLIWADLGVALIPVLGMSQTLQLGYRR